uniref:Tudor domain-containing protein n=3 Tax=Ciona intestinalis TaxID=7719 RepID=F6T6X1_CIOIN
MHDDDHIIEYVKQLSLVETGGKSDRTENSRSSDASYSNRRPQNYSKNPPFNDHTHNDKSSYRQGYSFNAGKSQNRFDTNRDQSRQQNERTDKHRLWNEEKLSEKVSFPKAVAPRFTKDKSQYEDKPNKQVDSNRQRPPEMKFYQPPSQRNGQQQQKQHQHQYQQPHKQQPLQLPQRNVQKQPQEQQQPPSQLKGQQQQQKQQRQQQPHQQRNGQQQQQYQQQKQQQQYQQQKQQQQLKQQQYQQQKQQQQPPPTNSGKQMTLGETAERMKSQGRKVNVEQHKYKHTQQQHAQQQHAQQQHGQQQHAQHTQQQHGQQQHAQPVQPAQPAQQAMECKWSEGSFCQAKYWEDYKFYKAKIMNIHPSKSTAVVVFLEYGNYEEVQLKDLVPLSNMVSHPNVTSYTGPIAGLEFTKGHQGPTRYPQYNDTFRDNAR